MGNQVQQRDKGMLQLPLSFNSSHVSPPCTSATSCTAAYRRIFYPDLLKKLMDTIVYHNSESMPGTDHTMMPVT